MWLLVYVPNTPKQEPNKIALSGRVAVGMAPVRAEPSPQNGPEMSEVFRWDPALCYLYRGPLYKPCGLPQGIIMNYLPESSQKCYKTPTNPAGQVLYDLKEDF